MQLSRHFPALLPWEWEDAPLEWVERILTGLEIESRAREWREKQDRQRNRMQEGSVRSGNQMVQQVYSGTAVPLE